MLVRPVRAVGHRVERGADGPRGGGGARRRHPPAGRPDLRSRRPSASSTAAAPPMPLPTRPVDAAQTTPRSELWQMMSGYMGVRTRFFDEFFDTAGRARASARPIVLAAGLDARAQRLDWAPGTTLFEVDQPAVLGVQGRGAGRGARRRPAAVRPPQGRGRPARRLDRRPRRVPASTRPRPPPGWPRACCPYLPAEAQEALLRAVDERSGARARGSRSRTSPTSRGSSQDPAFRRVCRRDRRGHVGAAPRATTAPTRASRLADARVDGSPRQRPRTSPACWAGRSTR